MPSDILVAAMVYAGRGWKVFPVAGKIPVTKHGVLDASTDKNMISMWWSEGTNGIALATGNGLVVLDVDPKNGGPDSLAELENKYEELPDTLRSITPSGGEHFYFNSSHSVRNSAGVVGPGIDIRGDGGYVVVPPSPGYSWDLGNDGTIADIPRWVLSLVQEPQRLSRPRDVGVRVVSGSRNARLASIAGALRRQGASFEAILAGIKGFNDTQCDPPLDQRELEQIARSVSRYEPEPYGSRRREVGYKGDSGFSGEGPDGDGLSQGNPLRRTDKQNRVRSGAWYLGRRR